MKDIVNPMEASHIVDRSDKRLRQVLRNLKHAKLLEPGTAWQEPDQPNGNWFIKSSFLRELAKARDWPYNEHQ